MRRRDMMFSSVFATLIAVATTAHVAHAEICQQSQQTITRALPSHNIESVRPLPFHGGSGAAFCKASGTSDLVIKIYPPTQQQLCDQEDENYQKAQKDHNAIIQNVREELRFGVDPVWRVSSLFARYIGKQ